MIARIAFMRVMSSVGRRRLPAALLVVVVLSTANDSHAQDVNGTGTLVAAAPVFLLPDATRVPLATLPAGTTLKVVSKEGAWYRVVFYDQQWGDRNGFVLAVHVRVDTTAPPTAASREAGAPARAPQQPIVPRPSNAAAVPRRGLLSVNGTYQGTSTAFSGTTTFVQNAETGSVTTNYDGAHPLVVDVAGTGRVWRDLAITLAVTSSSHKRDGAVSAGIPHPFVFNAPRTVSGAAPGLERQEIAVHVDPSLLISVGRAAQLVIFGGPSYFRLKQGLVTGVTSTDIYPYDTATFVGATTVEASQSHLGFNAGVDVTVGMAKHVGVGAIARYSRATLTLQAGDGGNVEVRAGGMQVGGGLRFRF
jgi:hypothetical protein